MKVEKTTSRKTVYQLIERDEKFSILLNILDETSLGRALRHEENPFTFFAPTDGAFYQMMQQTPPSLPDAGKILIAGILGQHIVPGVCLYTEDLRRLDSVVNLDGQALIICHDDNRIFIDGAQILTPAASAVNGAVFAIDKVLMNKKTKDLQSDLINTGSTAKRF